MRSIFPKLEDWALAQAAEGLEHYRGQNLLAQSLHAKTYEHDPGFHRFREESGLQFHAHAQFKKADVDERQRLYQQLAGLVWNPDILLAEGRG